LLEGTSEFTKPEVAVAIELIDAALAEPVSDDYRFIVSEEGDKVLGYACFGSTPMTEGCFDLYWLVVDPGARRTGVARELLGAVEQALRRHHARLVRVETAGLESYAPARALYENSGYERVARIRDFYQRGNDLYISPSTSPSRTRSPWRARSSLWHRAGGR
jgi:ribosomal protein S18 acetylase RimI-like enzyme